MDRYKAEKLYHMIHYFAKWYVPAYYTVPDVARLLRIAPESVVNYITAGEMKAEKVGGSYRVTVDNLKKFLEFKSGKKLSKTKQRYNVYVV